VLSKWGKKLYSTVKSLALHYVRYEISVSNKAILLIYSTHATIHEVIAKARTCKSSQLRSLGR
jgi:hypothetical protein